MLEKFGKSFRDIADLKTAFFEDNDLLLERILAQADLYNRQPRRLRCKLCTEALPADPSFTKHRISYVICPRCTHLNGMQEDTDEFCEALYTAGGGEAYAENYSSKDAGAYIKRRERIYDPKAQFLVDVLRDAGEDARALTYADIGAGAGYFVAAMREAGLGITGYEVSETMVRLGNWMMPGALEQIELADTAELCRRLPADVLSFIGVLEHLQNARDVLAAVQANPSVRYFYICVPLFSPCIFGEMVFPDVMPRSLQGGHTHLFTNESISHFESEFGFERIGAWWFGTDIMDHYRSVSVSLMKDPDKREMAAAWRDMFEPLIDDLQMAIDRQRLSEQVHMVFKVVR